MALQVSADVGTRGKMMTNGDVVFLVFVSLIVLFAISLPLLRRWWSRWVNEVQQAPIQIAQVIIEDAGSSAGVGVAGLMLIIFSFASAGEYFSATTVFQQIAALLLWIGSSTFFGVFIIAGTIGRKQTYVVYSDLVLRMETNIARLEKLQEQASSVSAVADPVNLGQVGAEDPRQA